MRSIKNRSARLVTLACACVALVWSAPVAAQNGGVLPDYVVAEFGTPPAIPTGALPPDLARAVQVAFVDSVTPTEGVAEQYWGREQAEALEIIAQSGDPRLGWLIADMMRFTWQRARYDELSAAAARLLGKKLEQGDRWSDLTNHLIAWDVPAHPDYLRAKRAIFTEFLPGWGKIFVEGTIDWRHVSWGGVPIDDRAYDTTHLPCNCIPAADNPEVSSAAAAAWLSDDAIVYGITINGESRAYPRRIMEVREMVNDTLGGRDLGIPYCTLCGAAQAYFTDELPQGVDRPILRTSGLLIRSNKVMYDITSDSVFDTFTGEAVTGALLRRGVKLKQASVVTSTWGAWKAAHPETTVLVEALALGRDFDFRNGRDAEGPIFPIGDVDPRLAIHEDVIGVVAASGQPVAFQRSAALLALQAGRDIRFENINLVLDGGGVRAVGADGADLGSHEAFWFAWSQFHPTTELWQGIDG